jgi:hypothetical protein
MKYIRMLSILSTLIIAGCASNPMQVSSSQSVQKAMPDESQIIFMRSSFVGSAINASLYDVTDEETKFLGIISNGTKVAYTTTPGKHTFMVVSEAADFMAGDFLPGRTYYSIVTPRMGAWKARFSLWPIRKDGSSEYNTESAEFTKWLNSTKLVHNSEESEAWYTNNKDSVKSKQLDYWPVWQQKTPEDLAKRTLNPQDGM